MTLASLIEERLIESARMKLAIAQSSVRAIENAALLIISAMRAGRKLLLCGNGGSAADCQHIAAELVGRYRADRGGLAAIALTTDASILTSVGNDFGFSSVFSRQVEALGRPGDVLLGVSTSGISKNVIAAMTLAKKMRLSTIALLGEGDGPMFEIGDVVIQVPGSDTARIQEGHMTIGHIICELVEDNVSAAPVTDLLHGECLAPASREGRAQ